MADDMEDTLYDVFADKDLEGLPRLLSDDTVQDNHDRIVSLLRSTGREGIDSLVDWLESSDYFTAPASTTPGFHGCYVGGLAEHSLNVYDEFAHKVQRYGLDVKPEEATIAGLLHDLVKVNYYAINYVNNPAKKKTKGMTQEQKDAVDALPDKVPQESKPYVRDEKLTLGHATKSIVCAMRHIDLTDTELSLIRWHMAAFDPEYLDMNNDRKIKDQCPAHIAFHHADNEASRYRDGVGYG